MSEWMDIIVPRCLSDKLSWKTVCILLCEKHQSLFKWITAIISFFLFYFITRSIDFMEKKQQCLWRKKRSAPWRILAETLRIQSHCISHSINNTTTSSMGRANNFAYSRTLFLSCLHQHESNPSQTCTEVWKSTSNIYSLFIAGHHNSICDLKWKCWDSMKDMFHNCSYSFFFFSSRNYLL